MTLIACFPTKHGTVIAADSQETAPSFDMQGNTYEIRKSVQKITPLKIGEYELAIAGMGAPALVDSFTELVERKLPSSSGTPSIENLRDVLEEYLADFYLNDVSVAADTSFKVFIAAAHPKTPKYAVWVSANIRLKEVRAPELIGWEHDLYADTVKRLYTKDMTVEQAALAAIYVLTVAKQTSNYVDRPFDVAIVRPYGIFLESAEYIETMEKRLVVYEHQINKIFLMCSDASVAVIDLEDAIEVFKQTALALHRGQIDKGAEAGGISGAFGFGVLRKIPANIPLNWIISDGGPLLIEHDREAIQKYRAEKAAGLVWAKEHGIEFLTKPIQCSKCQQSFEAKIECGGPFGHQLDGSCPNCGEGYKAEWEFESGAFS